MHSADASSRLPCREQDLLETCDTLTSKAAHSCPALSLRLRASQESGDARVREIERRQYAKPNRTLFVVNFEPASTFMDDLRAFFEQWGTLERVQLKTKFAFVEVSFNTVCQRCVHNEMLCRPATM